MRRRLLTSGSSRRRFHFPPEQKCWKWRSRERALSGLQRHGFGMVSQKGSHQKWRHTNGRQVIVAMHGNKPIPIGTLKSVIECSRLSADDFR